MYSENASEQKGLKYRMSRSENQQIEFCGI